LKIMMLITLPSGELVPGLLIPILKGGNDGFYLYTDALPSLDSATLTPQIYPEGKLRCSAPVFEPGGGGINVARAITHLGGKDGNIPAGGATGEHLVALLADEKVAVSTVNAQDWTRQNLHVHVTSSGEQYRFVMPGAKLSEDEFRQLEKKFWPLRVVPCWSLAAACRLASKRKG
jgi:fructose-1-phosphate kinase PfkB-like protein